MLYLFFSRFCGGPLFFAGSFSFVKTTSSPLMANLAHCPSRPSNNAISGQTAKGMLCCLALIAGCESKPSSFKVIIAAASVTGGASEGSRSMTIISSGLTLFNSEIC